MKSGNSRRARRPGTKGLGRGRRLSTRATETLPSRVPKRWVKLVVGIFFLPLAWVLTETFFSVFARAAMRTTFWLTEEFWFFSLGALLWLVAFFGLPRPAMAICFWPRAYARAIGDVPWRAGSSISSQCRRRSRSRRPDEHLDRPRPLFLSHLQRSGDRRLRNFRALPGRDPLPADSLRRDRRNLDDAFVFHLLDDPKGQPDLHYGGTFFSLVLIYVVNLALLAMLLVIASPQLTWLSFGSEFLQNSANLTGWFTSLARRFFP